MINFIGVSPGTFWSNKIEIFLAEKSNGEVRVAQAIKLSEPLKEGHTDVKPTCEIDKSTAQALMDNLWDCGLRPSEGTGSAGAFAAQSKHLEDMRTLVFKDKA